MKGVLSNNELLTLNSAKNITFKVFNPKKDRFSRELYVTL